MACREALTAVNRGNGPFGAVIVQFDTASGTVIRHWTGGNAVASEIDPTAHAEINVIRMACRELGVFDLGRIPSQIARLPQPGHESHCAIFSSCEPCPMCYSAIRWANIPQLTFAATRFDAAAPGVDFADQAIYEDLALPYDKRGLEVKWTPLPLAMEAFERWRDSGNRRY